jgi:hypothetical protein
MSPATPVDGLDGMVRYLKALADQTRLRLLGLLAVRERSVEELAALLGVRAPTVSHHLSLLKDLQLVEMRAAGTTHYYRLNGQGLGRINKLLSTPESLAVFAGDEAGDAWERKVLRDFFEGERLKVIPAQQKKRQVILEWLTDRFEWGRVYSEAEVNETIKRYHEDAAALRRHLIGARLMDRENGSYWRVHPITREQRVTLVEAFTWGTLYSQGEVDEILRRTLPDHAPASLRRELLDAGLLATRQDTYWRAAPPLPDPVPSESAE